MNLRPYQERAIQELDAAIAAGARAPLLTLPTGSGKTVIGAALTRRAVTAGQRVLFLAPRRELVVQTSRKHEDVPHGILLAGHGGQNLYAMVQIASIDTLQSRMIRRSKLVLPDFDLILVDEAHLSITEARQKLIERWPNALRIGLTATPCRKDGRALGLLYDALIQPVSIAELTPEYLAPARYFSICEPDLKRVRILAGDYHEGELAKAMNQPKLVGDIPGHWLEHAPKRRTVVFASSIEHSVAICEEYLRHGVAAEHVDANTPQAMRDAIFERFRSGQTQVLTNCFLASYGFDLPEISCVVLARPTKSLMLFLQMIGRGLRTAEGKQDCLILDHSGSVHRHGFAADERVWTLEGDYALQAPASIARTKTEAKMLTCPECSCVFGGGRTCPECGYYFAPKGREIKTLDGQLVEIGAELQPEIADRAQWYAELRGIAHERGWKDGWAAHKYIEKYGAWPPDRFKSYPIAQPSQSTRRWAESQRIRWLKSRSRTQSPTGARPT